MAHAGVVTTFVKETSGPVTPGTLRSGDRVRLRPLSDILDTLDGAASLDGVPFMSEMAAYAGRTMTVYRRLEKICDYLGDETRSRRMTDAVLLRETRCDGSGHGGCQAECRIFWKEVWLERVPGPATGSTTVSREPLAAVPGMPLPLLEVGAHRTDPEAR